MNIDLNKFTKEELLSMINDGLDHAKEQRLEIERLKEENKGLKEHWINLIGENLLISENDKLQERIDKAKEYIEEHNKLFRDNRSIGEYTVFLKFANELLKILKGSDK